MLFLHGFPESWRSWERQVDAVVDAGFRFAAPDLPGYGGTEEPPGYELDVLGDLVADLARSLGPRGVHVVGHDWGGTVAHVAAHRHPDAVRSLLAACAPHPGALSAALRDPLQPLRSWYVMAFKVPQVERLLAAGVPRLFRRQLGNAVLGPRTRHEWKNALSYYRKNLGPLRSFRHEVGRITQPGLVIHAARDPAIGTRLMDATARQFDDLYAFETIDSGHFVQRERAETFNSILLGFLTTADR